MKCKLSPNKTNHWSLTPLDVALSFKKMDIAEYLIKEFPGIFICTDAPVHWRGNTALHVAVEQGSLLVIKYLINDCKLDPYKINEHCITPLYIALQSKNLSVVKWTFSECPSVIPDAPVDDKGNTALHVAAVHDQLSMIKYLINECKLSPNITNQSSLTPLHLAFMF